METQMGALSVAELADLAGVTEAEIDRLVALGILVARDGTRPFLATDAQKVRLAMACEQAGLPMEGIALAIRAGRLSFAFLEAAPYRRWAVRSPRTYRQVSQETRVPLEVLHASLPGRHPRSWSGRTSWKSFRCCSWWLLRASWTWPGRPGSAAPTRTACA